MKPTAAIKDSTDEEKAKLVRSYNEATQRVDKKEVKTYLQQRYFQLIQQSDCHVSTDKSICKPMSSLISSALKQKLKTKENNTL